MNRNRATLLAGAISLASCGPDTNPLVVDILASPAADGGIYPRVCRGGDDKIYLSWTRPLGENSHELRFARFERGAFSKSKPVARGENWFVNWADFPSVTAAENGTLAAHWLERNGTGTYSYGIRIACSTDGGDTWPTTFWLHEDGQPVEHGFATLIPAGDRFHAVWLDGRQMPQSRQMNLFTASFNTHGRAAREDVIDSMVCECCATDAAMVESDILAVYRDRSATDVRDIAIVRRSGDTWTEPRVIHGDGWSNPG